MRTPICILTLFLFLSLLFPCDLPLSLCDSSLTILSLLHSRTNVVMFECARYSPFPFLLDMCILPILTLFSFFLFDVYTLSILALFSLTSKVRSHMYRLLFSLWLSLEKFNFSLFFFFLSFCNWKQANGWVVIRPLFDPKYF